MQGNKRIINLSSKVKSKLRKIKNCETEEQRISRRARIILLADKGKEYKDIAYCCDVYPCTVSFWIKRWIESENKNYSIEERLSDLPRSGSPNIIQAEHWCKIMALVCEKAEKFYRPITYWTLREIKDEAIKQKIVSSISERSIGRFLNENDLHPHKIKYWLNKKPDPERDKKINEICDIYKKSGLLLEQNVLVFSTDEKSGLQILQRIHKNLPVRPGEIEKIEHEYKRHGTINLFSSIIVPTGKIIEQCTNQRKNEDFVEYIKCLLNENPGFDKYHIVLDGLNIHKSEELVRFVAKLSNINEKSLGEKGKSGQLKNMVSREKFLNQNEHKIVFHYTPKHASWMNQIEIWFSILTRKLLKRGSFCNKDDLTNAIKKFVSYYNETMAKPFKWTYSGKALCR